MDEVRRHFRDNGWAVKVPLRLKELRLQLVAARGELTQRIGREPTATEIADYLDVDRELVVEATIVDTGYSAASVDVNARTRAPMTNSGLFTTLGGPVPTYY
jgi:RNA polymerase sigma-B factor